MNDEQFKELIKKSSVFIGFEQFKKDLTLKRINVSRLKNLYNTSISQGIEYLKQNPTLSGTDVKLIESLL